MRKEAHVLAFEGKTAKSLAIPLLAKCCCSIRQAAFCNGRTKRICWATVLVCALSPGGGENITLIPCRGEEAVGLCDADYQSQKESFTGYFFTKELNSARTQLWALEHHHLYFEIVSVALPWSCLDSSSYWMLCKSWPDGFFLYII